LPVKRCDGARHVSGGCDEQPALGIGWVCRRLRKHSILICVPSVPLHQHSVRRYVSAEHAEHIVALTGAGHHHLEARIEACEPARLTYAGLAAAKHNHTRDSAPIL
jgi:hypothetical protein